MSWPTANIPISTANGGVWTNWYYALEAGSTSTSGRYNLHYSNGNSVGPEHDVEFTIAGGTITINIDPTPVPPATASSNPTSFSIGSNHITGSTATVQAGDVITLWDSLTHSYMAGQITVPSNFPTSSGGPGGGSSFPPQRSSQWVGAAIAFIGWAWNTYQIYQTASGGSPIGGPGGGGWIADMTQDELVNEVTATIDVAATNPDGPSVSPGDELYVTFDEAHDDESANPNMTIDTEVIDTVGNTQNPSNTVDNTVTVPASGTIPVKIVCVRPPLGVIKVFKEVPDPNNEGIADVQVAEVEIIRNRVRARNFW